MALQLAGTTRHCLGDIVTGALTFPAELADRLTDTSAGLLILFGGPLAKTPRRISHSLAKLGGQSRDEPHRQAGADHRACKESEDEAVVSMFLRVCIHVLVLLSLPYAGSE